MAHGSKLLLAAGLLLAPGLDAQSLVRGVRAAIAKNDFVQAEAQIDGYRAAKGVTSEISSFFNVSCARTGTPPYGLAFRRTSTC
jgi:hypothetical protein